MAEPVIRGQPDWGKSAEHTFTGTGQSDLELGSRLNWPLSQAYDGELCFYDGFEAGILHWYADGNTATPYVYLSRLYANNEDQAALLHLENAVDEWSRITRSFVIPIPGKIGFGFFFYPTSQTGEIILVVDGRLDDQYSTYTLTYNLKTSQVSISVGGVNTVIGTVQPPISTTGSFSWLRMVVDLEAQQYKQVIIGSEVIPLSSAAGFTSSADYPDYVTASITINRIEAAGTDLYIDDVIVTRNVQLPQE